MFNAPSQFGRFLGQANPPIPENMIPSSEPVKEMGIPETIAMPEPEVTTEELALLEQDISSLPEVSGQDNRVDIVALAQRMEAIKIAKEKKEKGVVRNKMIMAGLAGLGAGYFIWRKKS